MKYADVLSFSYKTVEFVWKRQEKHIKVEV